MPTTGRCECTPIFVDLVYTMTLFLIILNKWGVVYKYWKTKGYKSQNEMTIEETEEEKG